MKEQTVDGRKHQEKKVKSMPKSAPHHWKLKNSQKEGQTWMIHQTSPQKKADGNERSPSRYFAEICRTNEGQTAKSSLNVEAAFRGRAGVDPCNTLIDI